jgi:DNA-binding transcriptional MerR regulator
LVSPSVQGTGGRPGVPRLYAFRDLVALRVVRSLLDGGMSLQRVRRSWEFLNKKAGLDRHLSEVKLVTDGVSIFKICRRDGEVMDALKDGQMAFFVAIDEIATNVKTNVSQFQEDREKFVRALREAAAHTATGT